jgi:hypothetical protein
VVDKEPAEIQPTPDYLEKIIRGAKDCGLPEVYQAHLTQYRHHPPAQVAAIHPAR